MVYQLWTLVYHNTNWLTYMDYQFFIIIHSTRLPFILQDSIASIYLWQNNDGKQLALFDGYKEWPFGGTNTLSLLRHKWLALFEGYTEWPFWGTNNLPFLRDKHLALFEGQTTWPFWGTNNLPFLRNKQLSLFRRKHLDRFVGQTTWPDKHLALFEVQKQMEFNLIYSEWDATSNE